MTDDSVGGKVLSRDDIIRKIEDGAIRIYPLQTECLTGIGYNLSPTYFVFSINRSALLPVYTEVSEGGAEHFVDIPPSDTALFFTREFVAVDETLAGTFHSKVSTVSDGLGHVSTTLDPTWQGQLLISIGNPTRKPIKFNLDRRGGNLLTLLFHELESPATGDNIHDNNRGRCDLLGRLFSTVPKKGKYKSEFLRLREYVLNQFADSLNGSNDFLRDDVEPDRYSRRVRELKSVRTRLSEKYSFMASGDYEQSEMGAMYPITTSDDRSVIESCMLAKLCGSYGLDDIDRALEAVVLFGAESINQSMRNIGYLIRVVDYELMTIDHLRRVEEQNQRALEFAGVETELTRCQREEAKSQFLKDERITVILIAILVIITIGLIIYEVVFLQSSANVWFAPVLACVSSVLAPLAINLHRDWKERRREWKQ